MFDFGRSRWFWLALGLVGGIAATTLLPRSPLHASGNDRSDTFAICTAAVDDDVEAIWFLDFLTGDLKAAVVSPVVGKFYALYTGNVFQSLGSEPGKTPKFYMVSGICSIRRGAGMARPSKAGVYVADANSGRIAFFNVPWATQAMNSRQMIRAPVNLVDVWPARTAAVRAAP